MLLVAFGSSQIQLYNQREEREDVCSLERVEVFDEEQMLRSEAKLNIE